MLSWISWSIVKQVKLSHNVFCTVKCAGYSLREMVECTVN